MSLRIVDQWMRATVMRVQWSQFGSVRQSALSMGLLKEDAETFKFAFTPEDNNHLKWHRRFMSELDKQVRSGRCHEDVGEEKEQEEQRQVDQEQQSGELSQNELCSGYQTKPIDEEKNALVSISVGLLDLLQRLEADKNKKRDEGVSNVQVSEVIEAQKRLQRILSAHDKCKH
eukprot:gene32114-2800_t